MHVRIFFSSSRLSPSISRTLPSLARASCIPTCISPVSLSCSSTRTPTSSSCHRLAHKMHSIEKEEREIERVHPISLLSLLIKRRRSLRSLLTRKRTSDSRWREEEETVPLLVYESRYDRTACNCFFFVGLEVCVFAILFHQSVHPRDKKKRVCERREAR